MKPHSCHVRGLLLLALYACGAVLLAGCQTTEQMVAQRILTPEAVKTLQAGHESVVLFRVTTTRPRDQGSLECLTKKVRWNIWDVSNWQKPEQLAGRNYTALRWQIPSETSGKAGWRCLALKPGRYFVEVKPDEEPASTFPGYYVSVPRDSMLVYAGSFPFVLTNTTLRSFPGTRETYRWYYPEGVRDETDAAREVGMALSPPLGNVTPSIAIPNDLSAAVRPYAGRKILAVEATNSPPLATPGVGKKAAFTVGSPLAVPTLLLLNTGIPDEGKYQTIGGLTLVLIGIPLGIAAFPLELLGDATFGSVARMNWGPHEAALKQEITEFNLAQRLTNSLQQALSGPNAAGWNETNAGGGFVVRLETYRVGLESVGGWEYAMTAAVHLSVTEATSNKVVWEHGFIYLCDEEAQKKKHHGLLAVGDSFRDSSFRTEMPFDTFINSPAPSCPLKTFKGESGLRLVQGELENAAARLSKEMVDSLKAAGF